MLIFFKPWLYIFWLSVTLWWSFWMTEERVTCIVLSQKMITRHLGRSHCTGHNICYQLTKEYKDLPQTGWLWISSDRDDRIPTRMCQQQRRLTYQQLHSVTRDYRMNTRCSTINRCLKVAGFLGHVAPKKPILTQIHQALRLDFCNKHWDWKWQD